MWMKSSWRETHNEISMANFGFVISPTKPKLAV